MTTLAGAVGLTTPLKGLTLAAAQSVAVNAAVALGGTGTAAGTSGLVIAVNANNLVFSPATKFNARLISGFSGSGIPGENGVVELSPFEFLDRLADLVPPPRKHRHRLPT